MNIMKAIITILFLALLSCTKDDINDKNFKLPPETQTGANTFGVTINNQVYIPRNPTGVSVGNSAKAVYFWGVTGGMWNEIEVVDGASDTGFNIIIHLQDLQNIGASQYILKQSNFQKRIYSTPQNHIYFKIWDAKTLNYAYYGSVENEGVVNVFKYEGSLTQDWILSGNFSGKFVRYGNPEDVIYITDGRFDLNLNTLYDQYYP